MGYADEGKQVLLFNVSGVIGTCLFYACFHVMLLTLPFGEEYKTTISWNLSYILSIVWQHLLHQWLVFGFAKNYLSSLLSMYAAYAASIALSTAFTFILEQWVGLTGSWAFGVSTAATGVINYFTVKSAFELSSGNKKESDSRVKST
eukprot:gb/GECG01002430.1/.p1 GENE.gb/GECG01002430.1/~~gb/GECG01002430.1/.p1  ORF type:complete len:147 (+),score=9.03 gb/GECG01002430.1/:1-441(+)